MKTAAILTEKFQREGFVSPEEAIVVEYGLEAAFSTILGAVVTVSIGICFGNGFYSFVLWMLIYALRRNAGGFHAETRSRCFLISIGMLVISYACLYQKEWATPVYILITTVLIGIIYALAPVENHSKPLDAKEYRTYRKRTRIILLTEALLFWFALFCGLQKLAVTITITFFVVGTSLVAGEIKLRLQRNKNT